MQQRGSPTPRRSVAASLAASLRCGRGVGTLFPVKPVTSGGWRWSARRRPARRSWSSVVAAGSSFSVRKGEMVQAAMISSLNVKCLAASSNP